MQENTAAMVVDTTDPAFDFNEYHARRIKLFQRFKRMRYGVQQAASHDLRKPATLVSQVLRGRINDPRVLDSLEGWLNENESGWRQSAVVPVE